MAAKAAEGVGFTSKQLFIITLTAIVVFWAGLVGAVIGAALLMRRTMGRVNGWIIALVSFGYYSGGLFVTYKVLGGVLRDTASAIIVTAIVSGLPLLFLMVYGNITADPGRTLLRIERQLKKK